MSVEPIPSSSQPEKPKPKQAPEIKIMLTLTLLFIIGVTVYSTFPSGTVRQLGVTAVSFLVVWAMYGMPLPKFK